MAPNQKSVPGVPVELSTGPAPVLLLQRHNPFDDLPDNLAAIPAPSSSRIFEDDLLWVPPVVLGVPSTENTTERSDDHTPVILVPPPPQGEETTSLETNNNAVPVIRMPVHMMALQQEEEEQRVNDENNTRRKVSAQETAGTPFSSTNNHAVSPSPVVSPPMAPSLFVPVNNEPLFPELFTEEIRRTPLTTVDTSNDAAMAAALAASEEEFSSVSRPPQETHNSGSNVLLESDAWNYIGPAVPLVEQPSQQQQRETTSQSRRGLIRSTSSRSGGSSWRKRVTRGEKSVRKTLFGDSEKRSSSFSSGIDVRAAAGPVLPRTFLPYTVTEVMGQWETEFHTDQRALDRGDRMAAAEKICSHTFSSSFMAREFAVAQTPPRMIPFEDATSCFVCETSFSLLRNRPSHCRNCGVCVCSLSVGSNHSSAGCSQSWPAKMIPPHYNIKNESVVKVCASCDWLSTAFRKALLSGLLDEAVALHATGNVNLRTPFCNVKGETFYPIHCAVLGGNVDLVRWLVDEHCCPISYQLTRGNRSRVNLICTSKGRSMLSMSMETQNIGLVRYLVAEKNLSMTTAMEEGKCGELFRRNALPMLEKAMRLLPANALSNSVPCHGNSENNSNGGTSFDERPLFSVPSREESVPDLMRSSIDESDASSGFNHDQDMKDSVSTVGMMSEMNG
eukprot:scaffold8023_cov54-Attheya_sp.AAC.1